MSRLSCNVFLLIILLPCCAFAKNSHLYADTSSLSCLESAGRKLDEALMVMKKHYYKRDNVQWDSLATAARARLAASHNCEDAFETVNWCFSQISEAHSFIMPPEKAALYSNDTAHLTYKPNLTRFVGEIKTELFADKGIAYLNIPRVATTDPAICTMIADSLQRLIAGLDQTGISKWIVDLRKNSGGNCWPMLAGIGPLLGNGICGYFVSGSDKISISYNNGAAMQGKQVRCQVSSTAYKTKYDKKWIIVLTGPRTSSSGEIVALAFKGKEQTLLYGEPTAGFTTGNATYPLSDHSMLVLSVSMEADRYGRINEGRIIPDQAIASDHDNELDDAAKSAAIMWLHIQ